MFEDRVGKCLRWFEFEENERCEKWWWCEKKYFERDMCMLKIFVIKE